ncbi:MAG: hypothetical protein ACFB2Z_02985 [Maricaulaceae bacterium]
MFKAAWSGDVVFTRRCIVVKKTKATLPYTIDGAQELLSIIGAYAASLPLAWRGRMAGRPFRLYFAPDTVWSWYLIWPVARAAGARIVNTPERADAAMVFEDATYSQPPATLDRFPGPVWNRRCLDVSKSHVARTFEAVFGYPLAVDPRRSAGPIVEKSETNGAHDGRILTAPCAPRPGRVYQKLIETSRDGRFVEDLRCPTVKGEIAAVFIKRRPIDARFANHNTDVSLHRPEAIFTATERDRLATFCKALALDWGGLDVLRERATGRLYVVDVNKTDMGPPTALPLLDQARAVHRIAQRFGAHMRAELGYASDDCSDQV